MIEWLAVWGVAQAVGFVFRPIIEDLAKDAAQGVFSDYIKESLNNVLHTKIGSPSTPLQNGVGKALVEFLKLFQQELEDSGLSKSQVREYEKPLKKYIKEKSVAETLGDAFKADCKSVDAAKLTRRWVELTQHPLPEDFDWKFIAKGYLGKIREIRRESEELRKILDSENIEQIANSTRELAGIIPDFDLVKYREGLIERYGNLKLESLDTTGCAYNELRLWKIFVPQNVRECHEFIPQIYEIPKDYQQKLQADAKISEDELERKRRLYLEQPVRPVLDLLKDQSRKFSVVLGDPGSGKSSLLQYLALEWTHHPVREFSIYPIPLLIELRAYARSNSETFLDFCHSGNVFCQLNQHNLDEKLKSGNVLVMFDGLDEIFDSIRREDVITEIIRFSNEYNGVRIIVTSRVIGYKPQMLKDAKFSHFMVQDLEDGQIQDFIQRWHDLTYNNEADRTIKMERLKRAIQDSSSIRQLAGNPLLLTMMAILNRNQELPKDRSELYNQASRVLLHQWDVERNLIEEKLDPQTIDYKDKQAMLRKIAFHMQNSEKGLAGNMIHAEDLERILTDYLKNIEIRDSRKIARLLLERLRTRNFILCSLGADYYAFVHRTFLEYFCAAEFVDLFEKQLTLTIDELKQNLYGKHWPDESWHEVLRLIAGMVEAKFTGKIIESLMEQNGETEEFKNIFLAADCITEVRNRSLIADNVSKLRLHLENLLRDNYDNLSIVFLV